MLPHLLDLAEFLGLILIGFVLLAERSRLNAYFTGRVGGGAGADVYMVAVIGAVFAAAAIFGVARAGEWWRSRDSRVQAGKANWAAFRRPALALGCVAAYTVALPLLGYFLSSLLFFAAFSRLDSSRVAVNAAYGVLMAVGFYVVFELLLGTAFPKGVLIPW